MGCLLVSRKMHYEEHENYWMVQPSLKYTLPKASASQKRLQWIMRHARGRVLDCGCNDGTFSIELAKRGHDVVGIDILPRLVARAEHFAIEEGVMDSVRFAVMDIERMRFPKASFDTCILTETLEHLLKPRRALKRISRVLRPLGILLVSVPNGTDIQPTHYNSFDRGGLEKLLNEFFHIHELESDFGAFYVVAYNRG